MAENKYLEQVDSGKVLDKEEEIKKQEDVVAIGKESLEFQEKEFKLIEELQPIVREGLELIEPTKKFEKNPKYWELQKELAKIAHLKELNSKKLELERAKKVVEKEEAKLAKLKGE